MDIETNPRYIAFNAVEIDRVGRRVTVAGIDTPLEPKAFEVLILLAQEPGKAFARDEILDAIWGHRHITPGVLNRVIALIRHALGNNAGLLHTLHGVGYRFDGEVRFFSHRETAVDKPVFADDAAVPDAAPTQAAMSETEPRPSRGTDALSGTSSPLLAKGPAHGRAEAPTYRASTRWRRPLALWLALLAAGIGCGWYAWRPGTVPAPTLVVLPLRAIGDANNEAAFADGLSEELATRLARIEGLHLISSTSAARAQRDHLDTAQLAERLHATHALEGSLREAGDQLRIEVRLVETPSGRMIWTQNFDRKPDDAFAVQQEITLAVAQALALRMGLERTDAKAPDPTTYREYLKLRHIFSGASDEGPGDRADQDLSALAARAPDFAAVHGLLALNLAAEGEGENKDDEALAEINHTLTLDPDNADAHAALAQIEFRTRNWAVAERELHAALAARPGDVILNLITGMWLSRLGYGERSLEHFRTAYAADPLGYWTNNNLGTELDVLGRHDEAKTYLDALSSLGSWPESLGSTLEARWNNAVWRHDFTSARDFAEQMPEKDGLKTSYLAVTAALTDASRWPEAEAAVAMRESKIGELPLIKLHMPNLQAARMLAQFEPGNQEPQGKLIWTVEFAALRRDPAFQDFLKRMKFIDFWKIRGWPPQCRPDGDGARCD